MSEAPARGPRGQKVEPEAATGEPAVATGEPEAAEPEPEPEPAEPEPEAAALQRERDEYVDALQRLQAEFENYKKRALRQQTLHLERAAEHLVQKILPVLDAADLAIAHGAGEAVEQIGGLLLDTLVKEGLEGIAPKAGEPFDPTQHEAVSHEPAKDEGPPVVEDLMRAGYRWRGHLLRPAMVKVRG